ncbi:MAG TPA: hypothetical protein VGE36_13235 [Roseateles sp.]
MKLRHWLPVLGLALTAPGAFAQDDLTVVRDSATGKLRAPTAEEAQELAAKRQNGSAALRGTTARSTAAGSAAATPLMRNHRGGAASARVTDEFISHAVARQGADGKLQQHCVSAKDASIDHTGHGHAAEE